MGYNFRQFVSFGGSSDYSDNLCHSHVAWRVSSAFGVAFAKVIFVAAGIASGADSVADLGHLSFAGGLRWDFACSNAGCLGTGRHVHHHLEEYTSEHSRRLESAFATSPVAAEESALDVEV